ncbi:hypothetical protein H9I32_07225 [Bacillus sp. Xin]|uniref:hypothetical protein n=1 Tax=unclassified Bacillus (in: firmicutes) TaxID=185979 RepID=UPI00157240EE|nr:MULTISPECIES: hypothetical protein [unclassified Bacillus (in: firmicutes)]MBC6972213.1 hypothetical protein [Bacillus sp. Xin]NSW36855.1 hypothetical protein [Bacillus sp. Xin1]
MEFGDTNFIGVVNAEQYKSFVDEDWELEMLLQHFADEMKNGNVLVFQMTEEGIEHSWSVEVKVGEESLKQECFRKAEGYIRVTENQLYLIDYDCLTMAAQFEDEKVPDKNCSKYKIDIENGLYKVEVLQFYNVDNDGYVGRNEKDIQLNFMKASVFQQTVDRVFWCSF